YQSLDDLPRLVPLLQHVALASQPSPAPPRICPALGLMLLFRNYAYETHPAFASRLQLELIESESILL
ncbi:MAG TPA: hypothetical protein PKE45_21350, partial [Caldilineaceae bacterium]|nr:hypothetical protein [Caldilineaceae bacterium]